MSLSADHEIAGRHVATRSDVASLRFLPAPLTTKFKALVEDYHRTRKHPSIADVLWSGTTRDFIECNKELSAIFRLACKSRSAKKSQSLYVMIAATILSLEALATDFASWGSGHFPTEQRKSIAVFSHFSLRTHLLDFYLTPRSCISGDVLAEIFPS